MAELFAADKLPARDENGWCTHPDLPEWDESESGADVLARIGYEGDWVFMDGDADEKLVDAYFEDGEPSCAAWTPTKPEGDGWLLVGIWDTEDGPVALFVRPTPRQ